MPIYHYKGYVSKEKAAKMWRVKVRTINDWVRGTSPVPSTEHVSFINVDGYVCVKHPIPPSPPETIALDSLEWVRNFAKRNKLFYERVYEEIIRGKISGVVLGDRIFVIKTEPELLDYVANYKRKRKEATPY